MRFTLAKILSEWDRGRIAQGEFRSLLFECLTPENLNELLSTVPSDVMEELASVARKAPRTDEEWSRLITFRLGCYAGPFSPESAKRREEEEHLERLRYRNGVETLRAYLEARGEL